MNVLWNLYGFRRIDCLVKAMEKKRLLGKFQGRTISSEMCVKVIGLRRREMRSYFFKYIKHLMVISKYSNMKK